MSNGAPLPPLSLQKLDDVRSVERVRNTNRQIQQKIRLERPSGNPMLQRRAVQKFHGDKCVAVLIVNFVDRADVRMIQGRCRLGFAFKAAEDLRVFGYVVGQECHHRPVFRQCDSAKSCGQSKRQGPPLALILGGSRRQVNDPLMLAKTRAISLICAM
jgi:hypothetical protein